MRTTTLIKAIAMLAVFAMSTRISIDTDTWWHLRAGEWIVDNHAVPQQDPFSSTRDGADWNYPGWLVEVPMYLIYKTFGAGGLNVWTAVMVTLTFGFVWAAMRGGPFLKAFSLILAAAASGVYWAARPYLITFLFSAIFLWILEDYRWGRKNRLFLLPILMIFWANSHGGFVVGFILLSIYAIDLGIREAIGKYGGKRVASSNAETPEEGTFPQKLSTLIIVGLLALAAVAINPSGPLMLLYPFKTISIGALQDFIAEWQSPNFHELRVQPYLWLLLLTFASVGFSRRRLAISDLLLFSVFTYLSMTAARNIALFALVAPVVMTRYAVPILEPLGNRLRKPARNEGAVRLLRVSSIANLVIFALLLLSVLGKAITVYPDEVNEQYISENYPEGAVGFLKTNRPAGKLFNSYNWGSFLLWTLPEYPVFIDGRTDLYDDELINTWLHVIRAEEGWQEILDRWSVDLILLEPDYPVVTKLPSEGWRLLYGDKISVLYGRE